MDGSRTEDQAAVDPREVIVAIPTLNEAAHIATTLKALLTSPDMAAVEIVVADGGSTDATRDIVARMAAAHPNLRLIDNPERLQAAAVNRVVESCAAPHHTILVRVDAHAGYPPGYVLDVARSLRARDAQVLATVMDSVGDSCFQTGVAAAMETRLGSGGSGHRGGAVSGWVDHGHHAGFSIEAYRGIGGYDTGFAANEDAEFDQRIARAGGRVWLDAAIRLDYVVRESLSGLARQYWRYGRGRAQTVLRHRLKPRARQMVPPAVVAACALSLLLAPLLPGLLLIPLAYAALLAATGTLLAIRDRTPCALWAGPALAAMHLAWGAGFLFQIARQKGRPA